MATHKNKKFGSNIISRNYVLNLPQMLSGGISENWLLKELGDIHWGMISKCLGKKITEITDKNGLRLNASFVRLQWTSNKSLFSFKESEEVKMTGKLSLYGNKMFLSNQEVNCSEKQISSSLMSVFSTRELEDNQILKQGIPLDVEKAKVHRYKRLPKFAKEYTQTKGDLFSKESNSKEIDTTFEFFNTTFKIEDDAVYSQVYRVDPFDDINGVGLLYFATYSKINDKCEFIYFQELLAKTRVNTTEKFSWATDADCIARDIHYYGNADISDELLYRLEDYSLINNNQIQLTSSLYRLKDGELIAKIFTVKELLNPLIIEYIQEEPKKEVKTKNTSKIFDNERSKSNKNSQDEILLKTKTLTVEDDQGGSKEYGIEDLNTIIVSFFNNMLEDATVEPETDLRKVGVQSIALTELSEYLNDDYDIISNPSRFFGLNNINEISCYLLGVEISFENETKEAPIKLEETIEDIHSTDIAITGVSCRLPGANNTEEFWDNLMKRVSSISKTPIDRWEWPSWIDLDKEHKGINNGGYIKDIDKFDPLFFGISPREAELMDPQQRLLLELTWELLEDSGNPPSSFKQSNTGVFIGVSGSDYELMLNKQQSSKSYTPTGTSTALLSNRISYIYDLQGPSLSIDTACSSSLVAINEAVKSISQGECSQAIVGSIHIMCDPSRSLSYQKSKMLSVDGQCHTFDAGANGYVRGEGAVMMLLKPLSTAKLDNDRILGVIKGVVVNHGGHSLGLTVPDPQRQKELIKEVYIKANIPVSSVSYIEAHGTGTPLGDPIEIAGLTSAFESLKDKSINASSWCGIGSVKTNIGHLEAAAGMAGVLKVLLSMKNKFLPALQNFNTLNPNIELEGSPFYLQKGASEWNSSLEGIPLRSGISSFGIGGTNTHIVIEEYIEEQTNYQSDDFAIILLSARNTDQLKDQAINLLAFLEENNNIDLYDIAYTLQIGREHMNARLGFTASSFDDLKLKLNYYIEEEFSGLYISNIKIEKQVSLSEEEGLSYIENATAKKEIESLVQLWIEGVNLNWSLLYKSNTPNKISLPKYPFERKRYWYRFQEKSLAPLNTKLELKKAKETTHLEKIILPDLILSNDKNMKSKNSSENEFIQLNKVKTKNNFDLEERLISILRDCLYLEGEIDNEIEYSKLGMDSITGVEFTNSLNKEFNTNLGATKLYDYPTVRLLSNYILSNLQEEQLLQENTNVKKGEKESPLLVKLDEAISLDESIQSNNSKKRSSSELEAGLINILKDCLYLEGEIDNAIEYSKLGMDSITGVEFINSINKEFNINLGATKLYDYPTIALLSNYILSILPEKEFIVDNINNKKEEESLSFVNLDKLPTTTKRGASSYNENPNEKQDTNSIAIVGLSGRYPKSENVQKFWDNISQGVDCTSEIKGRWDVEKHYKKSGDIYSKWLGQIDNIEMFDPLFFNISPIEAEFMDPQHRIFLEECWKALEDGGFLNENLQGTKCGTYVGIMSNEYADLAKKSTSSLESSQLRMTGNSNSIFAARLAYLLDLKGPSIAVDTACSSSLVSMHLACQALLSGEIDMAISGGVTLYLGEDMYRQMCTANMLSSDGKCKTFDNEANGFVPGEGAGVVVLKRLIDAERDGDKIYGVVKGTGINQDGKTNGITAPSVNSQIELLKDVYEKNNIDPSSLSYIEAHGTGTKIGDPIEVEALNKSFKSKTDKKKYCGLGSVKSNTGHTSAASGVAGITKVLLQMRYKQIAPTINFNKLNEHINLEDSPFYINTELKKWETENNEIRRAGISSFGFSGTNAHIVIEEYVKKDKPIYQSNSLPIILLSAKNEEGLRDQVSNLLTFLQENKDDNIHDIAYTLQIGRESMQYRLAFIASSIADIEMHLITYLKGAKESLYIGNIKKKQLDFLLTGEAGEAYIQTAISKHQTEALVQLWVKGVAIDWGLLYTEKRPNKISLPTYPFAKEPYWVSSDTTTTSIGTVGKLHPLLHSNNSNLKEQKFNSTYTGQESFLEDYKVDGNKLLPGVAYLELARAAGVISLETPITQLKDIAWLSPVRVNGTPETIGLSIFEEEGICFEVYSGNESSEIVHSSGKLITTQLPAVPCVDIEAIKLRMANSKLGTECYEIFKGLGLNLGSSFQGIEKLYYNKGGALSKLNLPKDSSYVLQPDILDSVIQTSIAFSSIQEKDLFNIHSVKNINIYGEINSVVWCHVRKSNSGNIEDAYDVEMLSDTGEVVCSFNELVMLPKGNNYDQKELSNSKSEQVLPELGLHLYDNIWKETALGEPKEIQGVKSLLILAGSSLNLADKLREILEIEVIHIDEDTAISYYQKVHEIVQSRLSSKDSSSIKVLYSNQDNVDYEFISGLLKTVEEEGSRFICKTIGVERLSLTELDTLINIIESEEGVLDKEVRYIGNRREVRSLSMLPNTKKLGGTGIKPGGVYLITGGSGGLGRIFATHISKTNDTQLILTGRSLECKLSKEELQKLNAVYYSCDITDKKAVASLITNITSIYNKLDGILHSAGIVKGNFLVNKTIEESSLVLKPKVLGAKYLDEYTKDLELDFIVYFSSISGVLGIVGQGDYSSANMWMDNYANYRNELRSIGKRHGQTLSINWPLWKQDEGMQVDQESVNNLKQKWGMLPLPFKEGLIAFDTLLESSISQGFVCYGNSKKIAEKLLGSSMQLKATTKDTTTKDLSILQKKIREKVVNIVSGLLKFNVDKISMDKEFGDYGFDSILLTKFSNELNAYYDLDLTPTVFYNYATLGTLSDYLLEDHLEKLQNKHKTDLISLVTDNVTNTVNKSLPIFKKRSRFKIPQKDSMVAKGNSKPTTFSEGVAVVGISGRFPDSEDINSFWENLVSNKDLITEIPEDRSAEWNKYLNNTEDGAAESRAKWGGFIKDIDKFDASFFNISPREAELMDPKQRITLEAVHHALEDAGIATDTIKGSNTGVFVGVGNADYSILLAREKDLLSQGHYPTGSFHSVLVNRISYLLDLHGPSEPIDTACSSSLIAIHRAVQNIKLGHCDMAIAGGVNSLLSPELTLAADGLGMLSEDGRCMTFDQRANGYVRSEGVGILVLKSLSKAEADGDHIYGVIRGTSQNHGGKANTLTSPNPNAQKEVLLAAYRSSGIDPRDVGYIEAHGTGTSLGDPIEIEGLKLAFKELYKDHEYGIPDQAYCGVGSVKTNAGHLEAAAGIAGMMKVLLSLKHKTIPGNIHLNSPNEYLQLKDSPFYLQKETSEWTVKEGKSRVAGVSSFGFGGANSHIIIQEYLPKQKASYVTNDPAILLLSAKKEDRLKDQVTNLLAYLEDKSDINLHDVAYTLQKGREAMEERLAFVTSDLEDLKQQLLRYKEGNLGGLFTGNTKNDDNGFVLKGNAGKSYIDVAVQDKEFESLAQLWVKGVVIDWNLLYGKEKPNKISLPAYPFERKRCWFKASSVNTPVKVSTISQQIKSKKTEQKSLPKKALTMAQRMRLGVPKKITSLPKKEKQLIPAKTEIIKESVQLIKELSEHLSSVLYLDSSELDLDKPFNELGLDSILGVEWVKWVNKIYQLNLKTSKLYDYPTVQELAEYISEQLNISGSKSLDSSEVSSPQNHQSPITLTTLEDSRDALLDSSKNSSFSVDDLTQLVKELSEHLSSVLYLDSDELDIDKPFNELGLDSILGVEWVKWVNKTYQLGLKTSKLYDYPTVQELAEYINEQLNTSGSKLINSSSNSSEISSLQNHQSPIKLITLEDSSDSLLDSSKNSSFSEEGLTGLIKQLSEHLSSVLYLDSDELEIYKPFNELGLDSILGVEWVKWVNKTYQLDLKTSKLYDYPTVQELAEYINEQLGVSGSKVIGSSEVLSKQNRQQPVILKML